MRYKKCKVVIKYYFLIQKDKKLFLSNALQTMKYCMCQNVRVIPLTDKILNDVNSHLISNCGTGDPSPPTTICTPTQKSPWACLHVIHKKVSGMLV